MTLGYGYTFVRDNNVAIWQVSTIYEDLIAANPNAGFDDVVQACKVAEIHETIEKLPQGYNTVIGEHGLGSDAQRLHPFPRLQEDYVKLA